MSNGIECHYGNFSGWHFVWMSLQKIVMGDAWVHMLVKKFYLLLSASCDEMLSWMIEIWMKNHLVSGSNCNTVILWSPKRFTRDDKIMFGLTCIVGDTTPGLQLVLSTTSRIGDTRYQIYCSLLSRDHGGFKVHVHRFCVVFSWKGSNG